MEDWLSRSAALYPDKLYIGRSTYAAVNSKVALLAAALIELGIHKGDRVGTMLQTDELAIASVFALLRIGAVNVAINTRLSSSEITWQLSTARCSYMLYSDDLELNVHDLNIPSCSLESLSLSSGNAWLSADISLNDPVSVMFTSGTTGTPKAVELTVANYYHSALASATKLQIYASDNWLLTLPLFHVGGLSVVFRGAIHSIRITLQPKFIPFEIPTLITQNQITMISLVPVMLHRLLKHPENVSALQRLRVILLGGAKPAAELVSHCRNYNLNIYTTYGSTELCSHVAVASPETVYHDPTSVGFPLPGVSIRILSLGDAEIGEIVVKSPTLGRYITDEQLSEFYTGDLGYFDAEGLHVVNRRTDLIISGGENIYPAQIEDVLGKCIGIDEACVVPKFDAEWGQIPIAVISTNSNYSDSVLHNYVQEHLPSFKRPKHYLVVDELPKNTNSKIQRQELINLVATTDFSKGNN